MMGVDDVHDGCGFFSCANFAEKSSSGQAGQKLGSHIVGSAQYLYTDARCKIQTLNGLMFHCQAISR